jgi:F420-non-reducing hydrogenase iron-sulfur subunit
MKTMADFQPKLLGFLCNWCAYAGADLAGVSRFQYPANMRVIRVMCSGRVDPVLIMKSLQKGIDGVVVLGCHPGDCHYQTGNYEAERKMIMTKKVIERVGIEPERLYLDWVSAAEGKRFSEVVTTFTKQISDLGPLTQHKEYVKKLQLGEKIVESVRLRWLVGKERELIEQGNVYHEKLDEHRFKEILLQNIDKEYDRLRILDLLNKPHSVINVAHQLKIPSVAVTRYITGMENTGMIKLLDFQGNNPRYIVATNERETP